MMGSPVSAKDVVDTHAHAKAVKWAIQADNAAFDSSLSRPPTMAAVSIMSVTDSTVSGQNRTASMYS
jgi:hypothetical protein